jgi:predicted nuclease of predicted toxin-antitoxin system
MPVAFYMDENIDSRITRELRRRELDVLTVQEDGYTRTPDIEILDRASSLARVLVTYDHHFVIEAGRRLDNGIYFYGIVYITNNKAPIGKQIEDLELIANVTDHSYFEEKKIEYLPYN